MTACQHFLVDNPTVHVDIAEMTPATPAYALEHLPAADLVATVVDRGQEWWRRKTCALALTGKLLPEHAPALLDLVRDSRDTTEVRAAVLEVLPPSAELLTWLRTTTDDAFNL